MVQQLEEVLKAQIKKWNSTLSILAGDYLLARSSELAAESLGLESVKLLASTYAQLVEGQTKEVLVFI